MEAHFCRCLVNSTARETGIYIGMICDFTSFSTVFQSGAPVAQWVKRWPTDLADRVRSSLEVKSSQP